MATITRQTQSIAPRKPKSRKTAEPAFTSQAEIAKRAYDIWLARGRESGHDAEHWLEAEKQLRQN